MVPPLLILSDPLTSDDRRRDDQVPEITVGLRPELQVHQQHERSPGQLGRELQQVLHGSGFSQAWISLSGYSCLLSFFVAVSIWHVWNQLCQKHMACQQKTAPCTTGTHPKTPLALLSTHPPSVGSTRNCASQREPSCRRMRLWCVGTIQNRRMPP